jgi:hypothetical protein
MYKNNNFKSVVISRMSFNKFKLSHIYIVCKSKCEKVVQQHANEKVLEQ